MSTPAETTTATTVKTAELKAALAFVAPFADKGSTIPICRCVLIKSVADALFMDATDLEVSGRIMLNGAGAAMPFAVAVPAARFARYVDLVTDETMELSPNGENHGLRVRHGEHGEAAFQGMSARSAEDFPEIPTLPDGAAQITAAHLRKALPRLRISISEEESRFTLNGALLEIESGKATAVSTDGHRLSVIPLPVSESAGKTRAHLSTRAIHHLIRADVDQVEMGQDDTNLFFQLDGNRSIVARKLTGQFPDYKKVMSALPHSGTIPDAAALLAALSRVGQLADSRSRSIHFTLDAGWLRMRADTPENGFAEDAVAINWAAPEIHFALNGNYLKQFLELVSGEVQIRAKDAHSPFDFSVAGWTCRVMPMRT